MHKEQLEFVGPLPPPLHGFAWVNQQMLQGLTQRSRVRVRNRAPKRWPLFGNSKLLDAVRTLWLCLIALWECVIARPKAFYVCCSGGQGILLDVLFVLLARFMSIPVYVHHHAFSYLNSSTILAKLCMTQMRNSQHIVLGERMKQLLHQMHAVPLENISILSNAAFLNPHCVLLSGHQSHLVVGFLSNITTDKGIFDFFDLAEIFYRSGSLISFLIAGPVTPDIQLIFDARLERLPNVQHLGALYGDAKTQFLSSLDVLAFPTRYANEAEPVTIHEALRAGVPVIANDKGCISSLLDETCGCIVLEADDFAGVAADWLNKLASSNETLLDYKLAARTRFMSMHIAHSKTLACILENITTGQSL